jgi:hypothetical protein
MKGAQTKLPSTSSRANSSKEKPMPEDSRGLRISAAVFALFCIACAISYSKVNWLMAILYCWLTLTGSYLSYYFRGRRPKWLPWLIGCGLICVLANFAYEIYVEFEMSRVEGLIPFIHALIGLLTLQAADLESRNDLSVSILIGLGLFACTGILGTDLKFGCLVLLLVLLAATMLYVEASSQSSSGFRSMHRKTLAEVPFELGKHVLRMEILPIISIPILSLAMFAYLPRIDSVFDFVLSHISIDRDLLKFSYMASSSSSSSSSSSETHKSSRSIDEHSGALVSGENGGKNSDQSQSFSEKRLEKKSEKPKTPGSSSKSGIVPNKVLSARGGKNTNKSGGHGASGITRNSAGEISRQSKSASKDTESNQSNTTSTATNSVGDRLKNDSADSSAGNKVLDAEAKETDQLLFRDALGAAEDDQVILYVASDETVYLRRMFFDKFDGHHWTVSKKGGPSDCEKFQGKYAELAGVLSLQQPAISHSRVVIQRIAVMNNIGHVLPVASVPQRIAIGDEAINVDDYGVVRCKNALQPITNYEVVSAVPIFDLDKLRSLSTPEQGAEFKSHFANYLQLPDALPTELEAEAQRLGGDNGNWFTKAEKINSYLKRGFKYSDKPYVDNPKMDLVSDFLFEKKEGACGQFASAFAVLCRLDGIPARVVGGYAPGAYDSQADRREICAKDGHSWAEIFLPEVGWVPFDSTPASTPAKCQGELVTQRPTTALQKSSRLRRTD